MLLFYFAKLLTAGSLILFINANISGWAPIPSGELSVPIIRMLIFYQNVHIGWDRTFPWKNLILIK